MPRTKKPEPQVYLHREELTDEQIRDAKLELLTNNQIGALMVLKALGEPIKAVHADRYLWARNPLWCDHGPDKHVSPELQYMVIKSSHVLCPTCGTGYSISELLNRLPEGKGQRKVQGKMDRTLALINFHPQPQRFYYFRYRDSFGLSTDPTEALAQCHPSARDTFSGVLLEVVDLPRARQVIDDESIALPLCDELRLRADMTVDADWHNAQMTPSEQRTLKDQQQQGLKEKRRDRQRLIDDMRREMNALSSKPL